MATDAKRRRTVAVTDSAAKVLEEMAREKGVSIGEMMRRAIGLEKYVQDAWKEGGRVFVEDRRGRTIEIVPDV